MRLPTCHMGQPDSGDPETGKDREVGTSLLERGCPGRYGGCSGKGR